MVGHKSQPPRMQSLRIDLVVIISGTYKNFKRAIVNGCMIQGIACGRNKLETVMKQQWYEVDIEFINGYLICDLWYKYLFGGNGKTVG